MTRARKKKTQRSSNDDLVPHPRYGEKSVPSGCTASEAEVRGSYFAYKDAEIFPSSAIAADIRRQNFSTFPRGYYVDVRKTCRKCERPFLFFAREQQHWYEELGFYIDADCVHCAACRRSIRELPRRFRRYSEAVAKEELDDPALETLLADAVYLWEAGVLRDEQTLRRLRNRGRRQIPDSRAVHAIERAIAGASPKE